MMSIVKITDLSRLSFWYLNHLLLKGLVVMIGGDPLTKRATSMSKNLCKGI